jgi:hypothetical protein
MDELLDAEDVLRLLRLESYKYDTLAEMGKEVGMYGCNMSDVLNRKRGIGKKILKHLRLREVKMYVPIKEEEK